MPLPKIFKTKKNPKLSECNDLDDLEKEHQELKRETELLRKARQEAKKYNIQFAT